MTSVYLAIKVRKIVIKINLQRSVWKICRGFHNNRQMQSIYTVYVHYLFGFWCLKRLFCLSTTNTPGVFLILLELNVELCFHEMRLKDLLVLNNKFLFLSLTALQEQKWYKSFLGVLVWEYLQLFMDTSSHNVLKGSNVQYLILWDYDSVITA